ncbi:phosphoribosylanthranilate isomerase [Methylopila sp. Yamaguchi]|uniref:phosphoribosylanthranilate isomerase n=1 Tax=Methylopila sp. Yamaguchi TaxID=1437817 RepID=UPI000CB1DDB4|nr:phosphoribosylanthranilate isomerase [Methylopila sp. Yamaguchi]GBD47657.1 phosphoribosylanthranilate isomerase [Methylopila sp. Yamaguchi]
MSVEIKICGLSDEATLDAALDAGASHVGFVSFPRSPRHVTPDRARDLARRAHGRAGIALLTVDADDAALAALVEAVDPAVLQLHGHETPERAAAVKARFGREVWKAVPVATAEDLALASAYAGVVDRVLFDAKPPKGADLPGGNGVAFDWDLLAALDPSLRFVLSGGLTPENVAKAVARTRAPAVDVSSGVESAPGVKDPERIRAFVRAVRSDG